MASDLLHIVNMSFLSVVYPQDLKKCHDQATKKIVFTSLITSSRTISDFLFLSKMIVFQQLNLALNTKQLS